MERKLKHQLSIIILLCCYLSVSAQKPIASETLKKVETYYKSLKAFDFQMKYTMYKGYTGNHVTESYEGTMCKNGAVSQIKILGSEIVQFPDVQLILNKENKTLQYNKTSNHVNQKSPVDVSAFLNFYKETVTDIKDDTIIHEMVLKNTQVPIPYSKIVIYVNKNTYEIEKQILYLATKVPFVDEDGKETPDVGRMEISFKRNSSTHKAPRLNDYVLIHSDKVSLTKAYQDYTIIDQTNL